MFVVVFDRQDMRLSGVKHVIQGTERNPGFFKEERVLLIHNTRC